jgi:hypothetical protein
MATPDKKTESGPAKSVDKVGRITAVVALLVSTLGLVLQFSIFQSTKPNVRLAFSAGTGEEPCTVVMRLSVTNESSSAIALTPAVATFSTTLIGAGLEISPRFDVGLKTESVVGLTRPPPPSAPIFLNSKAVALFGATLNHDNLKSLRGGMLWDFNPPIHVSIRDYSGNDWHLEDPSLTPKAVWDISTVGERCS